MGIIKKIQYNCHHATYLIEKKQQTPLSPKERLHLFIHLMGCSVCRLFQRHSRAINRSLKDIFGRSAVQTYKLDESVKQSMQEKINQRLPK